MVSSADKREQIKFYRDEITDYAFYKRLAEKVEDQSFKNNLNKLAKVEQGHSGFWKEHLEKNGVDLSNVKPNTRRVAWLMFLSKILGNYLTVRLLEHGEMTTVREYSNYVDNYEGSEDFRTGLKKIISEEIEHEEVFENQMQKNQQQIEKNRDLIYGVSDGLVEVLGSVSGLAAVITNHLYIALGGVMVGLSGTISMSLGAYLAKNSEVEFRINEERKKELLGKDSSRKKIEEYSKQSKRSAASVGSSYIIGAAVPILPFVFLPPIIGLIVAVAAVGVSQGIANGIVALSMNTAILKNAVRAALLSLSAAGAVFALGEVFHIVFHVTFI